MVNKSEEYWVDVEYTAREIISASAEVTGPIIDEHIGYEDTQHMDVEELTSHISQFYTDEQIDRWNTIENTTNSLITKHSIAFTDLSKDILMMMTNIQDCEHKDAVLH